MFVARYRDLESVLRSGIGGSESRSQRYTVIGSPKGSRANANLHLKESTLPEGCLHRTEGAAQRLLLFCYLTIGRAGRRW